MLKDSINICKEACFFVLNRSRFQHLKKKINCLDKELEWTKLKRNLKDNPHKQTNKTRTRIIGNVIYDQQIWFSSTVIRI